MKKVVALLSSLIILSGCASDLASPDVQQIQQTAPQVESYTAQDYQAQDEATSNKASIGAFSESIFVQNFADDLDVQPLKQITSVTDSVKQKGGLLFKLLNKSKLSQKVGYLFADYPVRANFNKKSKPDNIVKISEAQIAELKSVLKPGDMILCGNNGSFIHAIMYFGNDVIVHSLATKGKDGKKFTGVIKETLSEYLFRAERDKFVVLRYKNLDPTELTKVADYANKQIGKSYDTLFLMNSDTRFYCTELVYQSMMQLSTPPRMYPHKVMLGWQLITNEDFMDSPDLETVWSLNKQRPEIGKIHSYN